MFRRLLLFLTVIVCAGYSAQMYAQCLGPMSVTVLGSGTGLPLSVTETHVNVLCFGFSTGSIDITAAGGTTAYSYDWADIPGTSNTEDRTALAAGTYTVTVSDANGCVTSTAVTITEPATAVSVTETHVNVLCFGFATGSIDITPSGGTGAYTYAWAGGATTQDRTGLVAGTYTVTVTDGNGCVTSTAVTITEPPAIVAGTCTNANDKCQVNAGEIKVTASGGTGLLNITWTAVLVPPFTGPITGTPAGTAQPVPGTPGPGGFIIYSMLSGNTTYSFVVTDANGCTNP